MRVSVNLVSFTGRQKYSAGVTDPIYTPDFALQYHALRARPPRLTAARAIALLLHPFLRIAFLFTDRRPRGSVGVHSSLHESSLFCPPVSVRDTASRAHPSTKVCILTGE